MDYSSYPLRRDKNRCLQYGVNSIFFLLFLLPVIYAFYPGTTVIPSNIAFFIGAVIFQRFIPRQASRQKIKSVKYLFICAVVSFTWGVVFNNPPLKRWSGEVYQLFLIYTIYIGAIPNILSYYFYSVRKYIIPILIIFYIVTVNVGNIPGYFNIQRYCGLLFIPIFFAPYTKKQHYTIILFATIIASVFIDITIRSHLLNVIVATLIYTIYILPIYLVRKLCSLIVLTSFVTPIIFIYSALVFNFNIFQYSESISDFSILDKKTKTEQTLMVDSRSGIYSDAKSIIKKPEHIIFGRGRYCKYLSFLDNTSFADSRKHYIRDTTSFEAGILCLFTEGGILEALFITLVYLGASIFAIRRSRNKALLIVAAWIGFRYLNLFIDDKVLFNANIISTFILIGLCYNRHLLMLNDVKLKRYINKITR